ncbi:MAG: DUF402 domain-containing protein [Anaerolineae bacterium]|nr:DUF402 domain-containing protein [Anaerolineae bacterium]
MIGSCQVVTFKFDRRVHYTFPATLTSRNDTVIRANYPIGTVIQHHTRGLEFIENYNTDLWAWTDRWYNVFVNTYADGSLYGFYCNIAMPAELHDSELRWIDLDLDVRIFADGRYEILDEDEFEEHRLKYGYPKDVQEKAQSAVQEILDLARRRQEPFGVLTADLELRSMI